MEIKPVPLPNALLTSNDDTDVDMRHDYEDEASLVEEEMGEVIQVEEEKHPEGRHTHNKNSFIGDTTTAVEQPLTTECDWSMFEKIC